MHQNYEDGSNKSQKNQHKHRNLREKPQRAKLQRERETDSTIIMTITKVIFWYAKVSRLNWSSSPTLGGISIYTSSVY